MKYDTVYIVDDSSLYCLAHTQLFKKIDTDVEIKKFSDPLRALTSLRRDLLNNKKIFLVLDIEMPEMTGIEMVTYIAKADYLKQGHLNVLFVSSAIKNYLHETVMEHLFVSGKLEKPLTLSKLNAYIKEQFGSISLEIVA